MIPTRHLHPHTASTATDSCDPTAARLLHGHCTTSARLLPGYCTASARLPPGDCTASARLRNTLGSRPSAHALPLMPRHRNHAQNTQIPNPHASRTIKGHLNRAIALGCTETDQLRANQPKPNLPELNRTKQALSNQSGPNTIRPGTIKSDTPLPGQFTPEQLKPPLPDQTAPPAVNFSLHQHFLADAHPHPLFVARCKFHSPKTNPHTNKRVQWLKTAAGFPVVASELLNSVRRCQQVGLCSMVFQSGLLGKN